jgi:hypothetical protein
MDLTKSARRWVLRVLPYDRSDANLLAYLNSLDARALLILYRNWMRRLIKPQPRSVRKSNAFQQNPIVAERSGALSTIVRDIEIGKDLTKYLSRDVKVGTQTPGKHRGRRRDLDLMLNDWGIHHLHISTQLEEDGFVERGGPLLFAVFKPSTAYVIDVMQHRNWTRDHVLHVIAKEWPNEGLVYEIKSQVLPVMGVAHNYTDRERATLRKKHINAGFEVGGKVFMPAGGLSSAGTAIEAVVAVDKLLADLTVFENAVTMNPEQLKVFFESQGIEFPDEPNLEFAVTEEGYGVTETKTNTFFNLTDLIARSSL